MLWPVVSNACLVLTGSNDTAILVCVWLTGEEIPKTQHTRKDRVRTYVRMYACVAEVEAPPSILNKCTAIESIRRIELHHLEA